MNNKSSDQTVWMHRLVCIFFVHKQESHDGNPCFEVNMMLKLRLPSFHLVTRLLYSVCKNIIRNERSDDKSHDTREKGHCWKLYLKCPTILKNL